MHNSAHAHQQPWPAGPARRWLLWVIAQALLALTLAAGPRAVGGPLHWHEFDRDHLAHQAEPAGLARHTHAADAGAIQLDQAAQAAENLGSGALACAVAVLWPLDLNGIRVPRPCRDAWAAPPAALAWRDAEPSAPEHRPRA